MEIGFVYVWINRINGRYYIGSHKGAVDDGYIASGRIITKAIKKYGIENFDRVIEYVGPNFRQEETDLIKFFDACNCPVGYNITHIHQDGRETRGDTYWNNPKYRESMILERQSRKDNEEYVSSCSDRMKAMWSDPDYRSRMRSSHIGSKRSEESKRRQSATMTGIPKPSVTCPHCGKSGGKPVMMKWHFEKCKENKNGF